MRRRSPWGAARAVRPCTAGQSESDPWSQSDDRARVKTRMARVDEPSSPDPKRAVAPARACAYAVVRRVFEQGAWADRALYGEARRLRLDARALPPAPQLRYGTVPRIASPGHGI